MCVDGLCVQCDGMGVQCVCVDGRCVLSFYFVCMFQLHSQGVSLILPCPSRESWDYALPL